MNNKKLIIIIIFTLLVIGNITLIFLNIYKDKSSESNKELESNNKQSEKVDDKQATKSSMQIYESNNMKYWLYIPENATNNIIAKINICIFFIIYFHLSSIEHIGLLVCSSFGYKDCLVSSCFSILRL